MPTTTINQPSPRRVLAYSRGDGSVCRMDASMEIWKPVVGWESYQVSDQGRIRGRSGKIMSVHMHCKGYRMISLCSNGKQTSFKISHLVLAAFIGGRPTKLHQSDHINGRPNDDRLQNLEWVTNLENQRRKWERRGWMAKNIRGHLNPKAKLNPIQVRIIRRCREICELKTGWMTHIAKPWGVSPSVVSLASARNSYLNVNRRAALEKLSQAGGGEGA